MLGKDARMMRWHHEAALTRQFEIFRKPEGRKKKREAPKPKKQKQAFIAFFISPGKRN